MNMIQITIRCAAHPDKHAKVLRIHEELGLQFAELLAGLLDGTSPMFIRKPGVLSPIGKCATCGGQLTSEVKEMEMEDAQDSREPDHA